MANHVANVALAGARSFALNPKNRTGNAFYSMSWCALAIPFTILADFLASKLFTPTKQEKEYPLGAKKLTTMDDFGDVAFKTAMTVAAFAPITLLSKHAATHAGFGHINACQQPLLNQFIGNTVILIAWAAGSHLLGCLFEATEVAAQDC